MLTTLHQVARANDLVVARQVIDDAAREASKGLWMSRNVARLYRALVADHAAARRVLDAVDPLTCTEWRLVAAGWSELAERERAARCLEHAARNARTASDLCTLAMGYRDLGFVDESELLIDGARAVANRATDQWAIANTLELADQRAAAGRQLENALASAVANAVGPAELVVLAHAVAALDLPTEWIEDALVVGERRASTVQDFCSLATAHHYLAVDAGSAAAERCVAQASRVATSPSHERLIGETRLRGIGMPLVDDERPKLRPEQMVWRATRSLGWDGDAGYLLSVLRSRITRTAIEALVPVGDLFADDTRRGLLDWLHNGWLPHPLPAYFANLIGEAAAEGDGVDHERRAFACAVVALDNAVHFGARDNDAVLGRLLESCLALGDDAMVGARRLFAALADSYAVTHTADGAYMTLFAELGLVLAAAWLDPSDPRIEPAIQRMVRDDRRLRDRERARNDDFVLGFGSVSAGVGCWQRPLRLILGLVPHPTLSRLLIDPAR